MNYIKIGQSVEQGNNLTDPIKPAPHSFFVLSHYKKIIESLRIYGYNDLKNLMICQHTYAMKNNDNSIITIIISRLKLQTNSKFALNIINCLKNDRIAIK